MSKFRKRADELRDKASRHLDQLRACHELTLQYTAESQQMHAKVVAQIARANKQQLRDIDSQLKSKVDKMCSDFGIKLNHAHAKYLLEGIRSRPEGEHCLAPKGFVRRVIERINRTHDSIAAMPEHELIAFGSERLVGGRLVFDHS